MGKHIITAIFVLTNVIGGLFEDILVAEDGSLQYLSLCSHRHLSWNTSGLHRVAAMVADPAAERVFISDDGIDSPRLMMLKMSDGERPHPILFSGAGAGLLEGLTVSRRLSALFGTDASNRRIVRIPLPPAATPPLPEEGVQAEVVHLLSGDRPRGLALHDQGGLLFWTNWRFGRQSVERSLLDGSARQHVVSSDLYLPAGVAVDSTASIMFFLDTDTDTSGKLRVEATDLEGKDRHVVYSGYHPRAAGLQLAGRHLYWWDTRGVWRLPASGGDATNGAKLVVPRDNRPDAVLVLREDEECTSYNTEILPTAASLATSSTVPSACDNFCLHGECLEDELGGVSCRCESGFSGERCEVNVCFNFCLSGGTCEVESHGAARCKCPEGLTGERCQLKARDVSKEVPAHLETVQHGQTSGKKREHDVYSVLQVEEPNTPPVSVCEDTPTRVLGLSAGPLSALLISLLLLLALQSAAFVALKVRQRRASVAYAPSPAYISASAPRRIVGERRLCPRPDKPQPDIEDCCMMTLCETPCVVSASRSKSNHRQPCVVSAESRSKSKGGDCERRALVDQSQVSCNDKQALADLF